MEETKPESLETAPAVAVDAVQTERPLFDEFYDDWASFDAAIARATAAFHPIRKRSSLTFEVYNRTVSKGRHDRKNIADYLSKTFKCTHGIKFRSRGSGKRMRHKLRDIGCPFHVYASAVEFGPTYRVKVRCHDKHNHPIGPDSMKMMSGNLHESDYELATNHGENDAASSAGQTAAVSATSAEVHQIEHAMSSGTHQNSAEEVYESQMRAQYEEAAAQERAQAQVAQAQAHAEAQSQAYQYAQAQALLKAQADVQMMSDAQVQARAQEILQSQNNQAQSQAESVDATDILTASGHDSEALLDGTIDSTMGDDVFSGSAAAEATTTSVAVAASSNMQPAAVNGAQPPPKFEEAMTLESLRKRIADFADERDWNQFHTPRNLLLALNGEVGELCEIFQWKGEVKDTADWSARDKEHLGEEISDVLIYLVRLADKCDVNLPAALNDKIAKNARKYPADLVRGSSKKYNEYKRMRITEESTL